MNADQTLQMKKDALWALHEAKCRVAHMECRISGLLDSASKAVEAWNNEDGELFVAKDGALVAAFNDRERTHRVQFGGGDEVAAAVKDLAAARELLASAQRKFDRLR